MKFTDKSIKELKIKPAVYEVSDDELPRLKVRVQPSGSKVFYAYFRLQSGKERKFKIGRFGEITCKEARAGAQAVLAKAALGSDPLSEKHEAREQERRERSQRLGQFLEDVYYPWSERVMKAPEVAKSTVRREFSQWLNVRLSDIDRKMLEKWRDGRLADGISINTINRARTVMMSILNKAVGSGVIERNGCIGFKPIPVKESGVIRWLSDDEKSRLLGALDQGKEEWFKVYVKTLMNTGMRPCELETLVWDRVDLERRSIEVLPAYSKTGKFRAIPINDALLETLKDWQKRAQPKLRRQQPVGTKPGNPARGGAGSGLVISVTDRGYRIRQELVWVRWDKLLRAAGIKEFRLYDLRHNFASQLVMKGVDIYTVSKLLGHSKVEMTKVYAHLSDDHLQSAVNSL